MSTGNQQKTSRQEPLFNLRWRALAWLAVGLAAGLGLLWGVSTRMPASPPEPLVEAGPPPAASPQVAHPEPAPPLKALNQRPRPQVGDMPSVITNPPPALAARMEQGSPDALAEFVRSAAVEFRTGRDNVFFKEKDFLREFAKGGPGRIEALKAELMTTRDLESLPADVNYRLQARGVVVERMGMIDILEGLARDDRTALRTLSDVAEHSIDKNLPPHVKRALVGDKFDAFVSLTRVDRELAFKTFSRLPTSELKKLMQPALIGGLVDSGMDPDEATQMVRRLM